MAETPLSTKKTGRPNTFDSTDLEAHRTALTGHCYRMLGSITEADDAVQETMVRAWRRLDQFEGRSSLRTWLYRIATRVCLDALSERKRRARPTDLGPASSIDAPLLELPASRWIEPAPDAHVLPDDCDPAQLLEMRESIRLAFIAALQHLTPRQRAVLLWTEVIGGTAAEIAEILATSVASVNSALQRARATLSARDLGEDRGPLTEEQQALLHRYVEAFHRYDTEALTGLLREDVIMQMPPLSLWLRGPEALAGWLLGRGVGCRGSRLIPSPAACGSPAFGQYRPSGPGGRHEPWALIVLELDGDRIAEMTYFLDTKTLFPLFGLPLELPAEQG